MTADVFFWPIILFASFFIGLSKTGIPGVGILAVGLFTLVIPARDSSGVILPLLITADMIAVWSYRKQADWSKLVWLFPWAITGIIIAYFTMDHINSQQTARIIAVILLTMIALQFLKRFRKKKTNVTAPELLNDSHPAHSAPYTAFTGITAGFTTMVANAAGPIMNLYLLAMKMPKMSFMGTAAWYFFLLNTFKVPFSMSLGLINKSSILLNLKLIPAVLIGAMLGRFILPKIDQKSFETIALILTTAAAIKLLLK